MAALSYAFALALLMVNTMVSAEPEEFYACEVLFNETISDVSCCDSEILFEDSSESSKCNVDDEEEEACDFYKCLLEEKGLLVGDKIDEDKANEMFDKWEKLYPKEKSMSDRARSQCLENEKYLDVITDETCVPLKFYICVFLNTFIECQTWKTEPKCLKMKQLAANCKAWQDSIL